MIGIIVAGLVVIASLSIVFLVTPVDRRRGVAAALGVAVLAFGASATAPPLVQNASQAGAACLFLLGAATTGRRFTLGRATPVFSLMVVFAGIVLVTTVIVYPAGAVAWAKLAIVAVTGMSCAAGFRPADRAVFLSGLVGLALVESMLGFAEFFVVGEPVPWGFKLRADGSSSILLNPILPGSPVRISGSLGHPIAFATFIGAALLVVVCEGKRRAALWRTTLLAAFIAAIVLSGSRSVMIGVALGVIVVVWSVRHGVVVRVFGVVAVLFLGGVVFASDIAAAVDRLVSSGSYTNRASALDAVPGLLGREPLEVLFGSGFGSDFDLYHRGFFLQDGFMVIDNQLVTTIGTEGVVGLLLVVSVFTVAWLRGDAMRRGVLAMFAVMLFSFDYFGWFLMLTLLSVFLVFPSVGRVTTAPSPAEEPASAMP
ncbi:MAG: hypothetical protein V4755_06810 [Curtobacterium sp.]